MSKKNSKATTGVAKGKRVRTTQAAQPDSPQVAVAPPPAPAVTPPGDDTTAQYAH